MLDTSLPAIINTMDTWAVPIQNKKQTMTTLENEQY